MVLCDVCDRWLHIYCDSITPLQYEGKPLYDQLIQHSTMSAMAHSDEMYHCPLCRNRPGWVNTLTGALKRKLLEDDAVSSAQRATAAMAMETAATPSAWASRKTRRH